jgi:serine/threonine protein kinase
MLGDRYILGRLLGVGGFGVTYLALDSVQKSVQAVKEYYPTKMADRDPDGSMVFGGRGDKRVFDYGLTAFRREAGFLSMFRGEPSIVQASKAFDENRTTYYAMEYLDGVNLRALTRGMNGRLPLGVAHEVLAQASTALSKIHSKGVIHRDVSPENIYLTRDGAVKIIDFGAAEEIAKARRLGRSGAILLKPSFAPPEQYSNRGIQGPWTDIYALAASFYYVVSGEKVPEASTRKSGTSFVPLQSLSPEVSTHLSAAISKALALDVRERYQTMDGFARDALAEKVRKENMRSILGRFSGVPYIMIERGMSQGEKWPIPQNLDIKIGRQPGMNNVVILDKSVSREHCLIRYDSVSGLFVAKDISTNGVFSDAGERYLRDKGIRLAPGSRFFLAKDNIMMRVGLN